MLPLEKIPTLRQFINYRVLPPLTALILLLTFYVTQVQAKNLNEKEIISPVIARVESSSRSGDGQQKTEITPLGKLIAMLKEEGEGVGELTEETKECEIASTFTPEVQKWESEICRWSQVHQMDPDLIATLMQIESCGDSSAKSATGVRGLFQVTGPNLDGENPWDPNVSMAKGPGKVFKRTLEASDGNIKAAFAGYNGGGAARDYVAGKISKNEFYWSLRSNASGYWRTAAKAHAKINEVEWYAKWADIYFEAKEERRDTLQEWLDLGGHRLCPSVGQIANNN